MVRRRLITVLPLLLLLSFLIIAPDSGPAAEEIGDSSSLLIILDGLRPDYVTPDLMPHLCALGERGVVCEAHHSVFPTVTRVNSASVATGSYPATHGLMGNSVFFPDISATNGLSTGDATNLIKIEEATGGNLLTTPSLGEVLERAGKKLLVTSSGSTGSAFLLNHKIAGCGIAHTELVRPESVEARVMAVLGPIPPDATPNRERNRRAVDAYLRIGLEELRPDVTIIWLSDPDHTAHAAGIGAPRTLESIRLVDAEIGRIIETLETKGLKDAVNIFVASDHGFSTQTGGANPVGLLVKNGLKADYQSDDVVLVDGAIHVKNRDQQKIRRIVELLQKTDWVGAVFTKGSGPNKPEGSVPGTLSFDTIHWNHDRAADILVTANWSDDKNQYGYAGTTPLPGVAGHGTSSPYDIHAVLIAAGPDIKAGEKNPVPTGNVDLAPTLCHLHGIDPPDTMDGRILNELLRSGPTPSSVHVGQLIYRVQTNWTTGSYQLELSGSTVDGRRYVDYTKVERTGSRD
jgi:arylsulfatase A-like enzyme